MPGAMDLSTGALRGSQDKGSAQRASGDSSGAPLKDYSIARILDLGYGKKESSPSPPAAAALSLEETKQPGKTSTNDMDLYHRDVASPHGVLHAVKSPLPGREASKACKTENQLDCLLMQSYERQLGPVAWNNSLAFGNKSHRLDYARSSSTPARPFQAELYPNIQSSFYDAWDRVAFPDRFLPQSLPLALSRTPGVSHYATASLTAKTPGNRDSKNPPLLFQQQRDRRCLGDLDSEMPVLKPFQASPRRKTVDGDESSCSPPVRDESVGTTSSERVDATDRLDQSRSDRGDCKKREYPQISREENCPKRVKRDDCSAVHEDGVQENDPSPEASPREPDVPSATAGGDDSKLKDSEAAELDVEVHVEPDLDDVTEEVKVAGGHSDPSAEESTPRKKRIRTSFSQTQLLAMESLFRHSHYPDVDTRTRLGRDIGLEENKIQIWFQNRRAKWRKVNKLSKFGGLQEITATDYVPAPKLTVTTPTDSSGRMPLSDRGKSLFPRSLHHLFPFPRSALESMRALAAPVSDGVAPKLYPSVLGPPLNHGSPLPMMPYAEPRLPCPLFVPSFLRADSLEVSSRLTRESQASREARAVSRVDLDLGHDLDREHDVSRPSHEKSPEDAILDV